MLSKQGAVEVVLKRREKPVMGPMARFDYIQVPQEHGEKDRWARRGQRTGCRC